jgi:hypothetical protein
MSTKVAFKIGGMQIRAMDVATTGSVRHAVSSTDLLDLVGGNGLQALVSRISL